MRIQKLKIKNFRCFGPEEQVIYLDPISTIIGANSSGKTAVLHALLKLFGIYSKDREIKRSDFHIPAGKRPDEIETNRLHIEAIIDFPELRGDNLQKAQNTISPFFDKIIVSSQNGFPVLRVRLEATWQKGRTPEGEIESKLQFITCPEGDKISDNDRLPVLAEHRTSIQVMYIPAIREPAGQLRNVSGTILWRILNSINWPENFDDEVSSKIKELDEIFYKQESVGLIKRIIGEKWSKFHKDSRYTEAKLRFNSSDLEAILKRIEVEFAPTQEPRSYSIDSLGEGLRSLFYFSLVSSLLELEANSQANPEYESLFDFNSPALTILAVEEPENHIAPQLLGKVIQNLLEISNKNNAQVLLTSHTPAIVKRVPPESICHLRICPQNACSIPNKILLPEQDDEAHKYVKEAVTAYPEIYFARLVILGEGDTEEIVIKKAIQASGNNIDFGGICVVPLGGRFVNHFWRLLSNLQIPYLTLLDLDFERYQGGWGRIKYAISKLIEYGCEKEHLLRTTSYHYTSKFSSIREAILSLSRTGENIIPSCGSYQIMSDEDLKNMDSVGTNLNENQLFNVMTWMPVLESYNLFFSDPLDLDFSMLIAFQDEYKAIAPQNGGPRIPSKIDNYNAYNERVKKAVKRTLKAEGGDGKSYTEEQRELMIWYNYLFLGRGKPSTHILALSKIDDDKLWEHLSPSLKRLINKAISILENDHCSDINNTNSGGECVC